MSCEFDHDVQRWHDGELSAERRELFAQHLASCSDCRQQLHELEQIGAALQARASRTMPAAALARLHDSVHRLVDRSVLRIAEWLTAAAAVLLAIGLAMLIYGQPAANRATRLAADLTTGDVTMPDEVVGGTGRASGDSVELAQWVEPSLGLERKP